MAKETEIQLIRKMDKNDKAIRVNIANIRKKYPNQYIAVDGGKVILHNENLDTLRKMLEKSKQNLKTVLIEYIPEEGITVLY